VILRKEGELKEGDLILMGGGEKGGIAHDTFSDLEQKKKNGG